MLITNNHPTSRSIVNLATAR